MTNKKVTRKALLMSITSLLICISMLLGTTFAWFTDEVTSGVNKIVAGNLDVKLEHSVNGTSFSEVTADTTDLFQTAASGILWEPGAMAMETFKVTNVGNLTLKYQFNINQLTEAYYSKVTWDNGTNYYDLTDVIKMVITDTRPATREAATALFTTSSTKSISKTENVTLKNAALVPGAVEEFTVVLYWAPDSDNNVTDNLHNLKNTGWSLLSPANATTPITAHDTNNDTKDYLYIEPSVTLLATQQTSEYDSFDNTYDASAETSKWNAVTSASANANVTGSTAAEKTATLTAPVAPATSGSTTVKLTNASTNGALDTATSAKLDVKTTDILNSSSFTITGTSATSEAVAATIDLTLTLTKTTTENNTTTTTTEPATDGFTAKVETYVAKGLSEVTVNYNGDANLKFGSSSQGTSKYPESAVTEVGDYYYNADTGKLVFITDHFSQYLVGTTSVAYVARHANNDVEVNTAYDKLADAIAVAGNTAPIYLLNNTEFTPAESDIGKEFYVYKQGKALNTNTSKTSDGIDIKVEETEVTPLSNVKYSKYEVSADAEVLVNETIPTSLEKALQMNDATTIKLLKDLENISGLYNYKDVEEAYDESYTYIGVETAQNFTLDLNGKKLTAKAGKPIAITITAKAYIGTPSDNSANAKVTITDSASGGIISGIALSHVDLVLNNLSFSTDKNVITINSSAATSDVINLKSQNSIKLENCHIKLTGNNEFIVLNNSGNKSNLTITSDDQSSIKDKNDNLIDISNYNNTAESNP